MNVSNRQLLFLFICLPMRLIMSFLPIYLNKYLKKIYSMLLLIIGLSFLYLYFFNSRQKGIFNQPAWWHNIRLLHGMLFLTASIYLFNNSNISTITLLLDVFIGLILFINNHYLKLKL